jgi:type I restriction enzyme S subunit
MEYAELSDLTTSIIDCPHSTPKWTSEGIFVIRNYNLVDGRIDLSGASYVSEEEYDFRIRRGKPEAGDIVLSREAPIGNIGIIPEGLKCCLGQRVVLIKVDRNKYDPYFLALVLQSRFLQHQMHNASGTGTTVSNLRIPYIEKLRIPIIVRQLQESIVKIIKCINDKIDCCNDINDNLEALCQTKYFEMMEGLTLDYGEVQLSDYGEIVGGSTPSKSNPDYYTESGIAWLTPKDLSVNKSKFIAKGSIDIT